MQARWSPVSAALANVDFVRGLGADHVIDYSETRFTDVLRDQHTIGCERLRTCGAALTAAGLYLTARFTP